MSYAIGKQACAGMYLSSVLLTLAISGCRKTTDMAALAPQIASVTVYDLDETDGYSPRHLATAFQTPLDVDLVKEFLLQAKYHDDRFFWTEGSSLAVVKLNNGVEKKIALAYNGGFWIVGEKGYYVLEGEAKEQFEQAFNKRIIQDIFVPKRMERNKAREKK